MPADVLSLAARYRAALLAQDTAALARLVTAYAGIARRLQGAIDALGMELAGLDTAPTRGQVLRMARYKALLEQVQDELTRYQAFAGVEMSTAARAAIDLAQRHARGLVDAQAGVRVAWNRLDIDTIESLLGFLDPAGPLYKRLENLSPFMAQRVADTILENIALGHNPRAWAGLIRDQLGVGLSQALTMARTVQIKSYQEATRANYVANADIVQSWIWYAELDADVCMSCVAQHGSVHPLDESLNDHHNGRCTAIPWVVDADNPVGQGGQEWFDSLSADEQRAMMGNSKHDAYTAGTFDFGAQSATHTDDIYGELRVETPLRDLVGA